jgi:hypothetical protein
MALDEGASNHGGRSTRRILLLSSNRVAARPIIVRQRSSELSSDRLLPIIPGADESWKIDNYHVNVLG